MEYLFNPGNAADDVGHCSTFLNQAQSGPVVVQIDLGKEVDCKTVYVMGTVYTAKWMDLVGVKMYMTASSVTDASQL